MGSRSDQSIRASQTNIGLFNLASEENEECGCANGSSGGGMITIIEVIAILITSIIVIIPPPEDPFAQPHSSFSSEAKLNSPMLVWDAPGEARTHGLQTH